MELGRHGQYTCYQEEGRKEWGREAFKKSNMIPLIYLHCLDAVSLLVLCVVLPSLLPPVFCLSLDERLYFHMSLKAPTCYTFFALITYSKLVVGAQ